MLRSERPPEGSEDLRGASVVSDKDLDVRKGKWDCIQDPLVLKINVAAHTPLLAWPVGETIGLGVGTFVSRSAAGSLT